MQPVTPEDLARFGLVAGGYAYFQALLASARLGLFELLEDRPNLTLPEIAHRLKIPEPSAHVILLAMTAPGIVRKNLRTGRYSNSTIASTVLVKRQAQNVLPYLELHQAWYEPMGLATESLRKGTNRGLTKIPGKGKTVYERQSQHPWLEALFHAVMGHTTGMWTDALAQDPLLPKVKHLLDVAGGDGNNAIHLCRRFPKLRVTIVDFPSVCSRARKTIARAGLSDRIKTVGADVFADPLPKEADAVAINHILEIFSPAKNLKLLKKAYGALPSKGVLFVSGYTCNPDETGPLTSAVMSMFFLCVASGEGRTYTPGDYEAWMKQAGFSKVMRREPEIDWPDHSNYAAVK